MELIRKPLHLDAAAFQTLLVKQGPSLGFWRAAGVAALPELDYPAPVVDLGGGDGLVTSLVLPQVDTGLDPDPQAVARGARSFGPL